MPLIIFYVKINLYIAFLLVPSSGRYIRFHCMYYENVYSCIEPQTTNLRLVFKDSTPTSPLIFILSPGTDSSAELLSFAAEMKFTDKLLCVCLGQGQGPVAVKKMKEGMESGKWVFLQDCHLYPSWMSTLEHLVKQIDINKVRFVIRKLLLISGHNCTIVLRS